MHAVTLAIGTTMHATRSHVHYYIVSHFLRNRAKVVHRVGVTGAPTYDVVVALENRAYRNKNRYKFIGHSIFIGKLPSIMTGIT